LDFRSPMALCFCECVALSQCVHFNLCFSCHQFRAKTGQF
jgi:hypothetical protein